MLRPDEMVLLTNALKPPQGFALEVSVTTTYSMDLKAMLLAPMTFALHSTEEISGQVDAIEVLDAAQQHVGKTTVFCQAGGIHEPSEYSALFDFLEGSIQQVRAPDDSGAFHPKLWAVRYRNEEEGQQHHRVLVSSRNLTLDESRDTLLVLDEESDGVIDAGPAAGFIESLLGLPGVELTKERREALGDLAESLAHVAFAVPPPFTGGHLLPLGLGEEADWPYAGSAEKILAISPFLSPGMLARVRGGAEEVLLISREDELNRLGKKKIAGWPAFVLDRAVEGELAEESDDSRTPFAGLHAKTTVQDLPDGTSRTITGSANLTDAAWTSNVEFNAVLSGPTEECGVGTVLDAGGGLMGLESILQPFEPETESGETDARRAIEFEIQRFHRDLALTKPHLDLLDAEEGRVNARLTLGIPENAPGTSTVRLLTLPKDRAEPMEENLSWNIAKDNVTAFLVVSTKVVKPGEDPVTRSCCLLATVAGDVPNRTQSVLDQLITNAGDELRYLALLLDTGGGTSAFDAGATVETKGDGGGAVEHRPERPSPVLFEPLMRAVTDDSDHLASIAARVQELRVRHERHALKDSVFEEFGPMWDAVHQALTGEESTR